MSDRSTIEWTDATWNPVRGCAKISPGCKHCYAETFAERFRGVRAHPFEQGFDLRLVPEKLGDPLRWRSPRKIFVNSMSDLFQEGVPTEYIAEVGRIMESANWHTYQVLTKRHRRMRELLCGELSWLGLLPNVWFGVSVENRRHGLPRLETLRATPAVIRFISYHAEIIRLFREVERRVVGQEASSVRLAAKERKRFERTHQPTLFKTPVPDKDQTYAALRVVGLQEVDLFLPELLREAGTLSYRALWPRVLETCHLAESDLKKLLWEMGGKGRIVLSNVSPQDRTLKDHHRIRLPGGTDRRL